MAKVIGIGGIFFRARDPAALAQWYQQHLGLPIDPGYGGAAFQPDTMPDGGMTLWSPFKADTGYFAPSDKPFMINLVVDDLDQALAQVRAAGAQVMDETQDEPYGRFGWFIDPEGTKVELWQPKPMPAGD